MNHCFPYLTAVLDWHSRYVLNGDLSNTLDVGFCLSTLAQALRLAPPLTYSTLTRVASSPAPLTGCHISRDGLGRITDNAFIERLWRTVK